MAAYPSLDTCPIVALLVVVEYIVGCGGTVHRSFCHQCGRLSWYLHWMWRWWMLYLEVFSCSHLYIIMILLGLHPYGLCGLSPISREVSVPQVPRASCPPWFPWPNCPDWAGLGLMDSWAQLHLEWISLEGSLSLGFLLPHYILWLEWYYFYLVCY